MNGGFVLALGLAAIDGLTSAFVAMLIMALVVAGGNGGASGKETDKALIVTIAKHAPVKLMVRLAAGDGKPVPVYALDQNTFQTIDLSASTEGGRILWRDCSVSPGGGCTAQLIIERPQDGQKWTLQFAIATTDAELTETLSRPVKLDLKMAGGGAVGKAALCWDSLAAGWQKVVFFTARDGISGGTCQG
ncbi:hypothetical protein HJB89_11075 [Rhizobium sp. NZLR8]|uniref:hypothetical protein n=1 Tax=Rhizobium sp. NZLR8 TaxID=2731104 RepID=UPI001C82DB06|nr:hypothetical protein [Rhizobium sp. NZLR8]MBX5157665.1 hypothetical protein [Rhizobium sp. NZLR8]